MLVSAPVLGPKGERVIAYFGEFGKLDGFITDIVEGGFLLDLAVNKSQREKLANKLEWIEKRQKDPSVVDVAESAYDEVSRRLNYQITKKIPLNLADFLGA